MRWVGDVEVKLGVVGDIILAAEVASSEKEKDGVWRGVGGTEEEIAIA